MEEMIPKVVAQDHVNAVIQQRDEAQEKLVFARVALAAKEREIEALKAELDKFKVGASAE